MGRYKQLSKKYESQYKFEQMVEKMFKLVLALVFLTNRKTVAFSTEILSKNVLNSGFSLSILLLFKRLKTPAIEI